MVEQQEELFTYEELQNQNMKLFWKKQLEEIKNLPDEELKELELPLARIKKIMKLNKGVEMVAQGTPAVFAKACELFIEELTLRAWIRTEENERWTLQSDDITHAMAADIWPNVASSEDEK